MSTKHLKHILAMCAILAAHPVYALSIEEAIALGVTNNPAPDARAAQVDSAKEQLNIAKGRRLPSVTVQAGYGNEKVTNRSLRAANDDDKNMPRQEVGLNITQSLFSGFAIDAGIAQNESLLLTSRSELLNTQDQIALQIAEAYIRAWEQQQILKFAERTVKVHQDILKQLEARYDSGASRLSDITQTRSRFLRAQSIAIETANQLQQAKNRLERLMGQPLKEVEDTIPFVYTPPTDMNALVDDVLERNPRLQSARAAIVTSETEIKISQSRYYPNLRLEGNADYQKYAAGEQEYANQQSLMLRSTWNLFSGGADKARVNAARAEKLAQEYNKTDIEQQLKEQAESAFIQLTRGQQSFRALEKSLEEAQKTYDLYNEQFTVGKRFLLDVLDAQSELFLVQREKTQSNAAMVIADYQIKALKHAIVASTP